MIGHSKISLAKAIVLISVLAFSAFGQDTETVLQLPTEDKRPEWEKLSTSLDDALTDLGTKYFDASKKIDQKFLEQSEQALAAFLSSMEEARKRAMLDDKLDKAIEFEELKKRFETWSSSTALESEPPATKKDRKKEPLLGDFEKKIETIVAERALAIHTLGKQFLDRANAKRLELLASFEVLRLQAMKADAMADARLIREEMTRIKQLDLSVPKLDDIETSEEPKITESPARKEICVNVLAIKPLKDSSGQATIAIPIDVVRVEATFFNEGDNPELQRSRHPGYNGTLRVNGKLVVAFARKYKWKDGKIYTLAIASDGGDINTRDPATENGVFDITKHVEPGKNCNVSYSNGQRTPIGVRLLYYRVTQPEQPKKP